VAFAVYAAINVAIYLLLGPLHPDQLPHDWALWRSLDDALANGRLHEANTLLPYVWSPITAPFMAFVGITGFWPMALAQIASLILLRDRALILLVLVSYGFWPGVMGGNAFTFIFVAGVLAFRGSRHASLVYLALLILIPRPVQIPLAVWLMWRDRSLIPPAIAMLAAHSAAVAMTGYAVPWVDAMLWVGTSETMNLGPSALFGAAWFLIGVPAAIWLAVRGQPGWAGVAATPYVLQGYLLMPLVAFGAPARSKTMTEKENGDAIPVHLAPAGVLGGAGDEGGLRGQEDRIGAVRVQE
jgi:hypothetical protein